MEDIGLFTQTWQWMQSQRNTFSRAHLASSCMREKIGIFMDRYWPAICNICFTIARFILFLSAQWKNSIIRGCLSFAGFGSAALLLTMWSCVLSLTSISCLIYLLLSMVWVTLYAFYYIVILSSLGVGCEDSANSSITSRLLRDYYVEFSI